MFLSLPEVPLPGSQSLIPTVHSNFATLAHSQLVLAQDWAIEWEAKKVEWISLKNMFIKPRLWPFPSVICCAELLLRCCPWGWSVFFGHPFTSPSLWCSLQTSTTSGYGCCWSRHQSRAGCGHQKEWKGMDPPSPPEHLQRLSGFMAAPWVGFQTLLTEQM